MKHTLLLAVTLFALAAPAAAEDTVYGRELMTEQERIEHREKMRSFQSEADRQKYREEHHKRMQERAEKMGKKLPDGPGPMGKGMERGGGMGGGGGGRR